MAYRNQDDPGSSSRRDYSSNNPLNDTPPQYSQLDPNTPRYDTRTPSSLSHGSDINSISSSENERDLEPGNDEILTQALEFTHHIPPPSHIPSPLPKPIAIPQTLSGTGQAFARCWAPTLTPYNITPSDFLEFIDNLNVVSTANPPLQILGLVGSGIGMVPSHIAQMVSLGMQVLVKLGTTAVSKSRTDMYMKAVNEEFFAPRGLKAVIADRDAMAMSLGLPEGVGRLAPVTDENMGVSMLERRLEDMRPYMAELRFDVPSPVAQTTVLAKMSAAQVKWQMEQTEKKVLKYRRKQMMHLEKEKEKHQKGENKEQRKFEKEMRKLDRDVRKAEGDAQKDSRKGGRSAEKAERKLREEMVKIDVDRRKVERGFEENARDRAGMESRVAKKDKESKQAMKVLWILIENL